MTKIAASQHQDVIAMRRAGLSRNEVASMYGVTPARITGILRTHGAKVAPAARKHVSTHQSRNQAIVEMYKAGNTQTAVAAAFEMSAPRISGILAAMGVARHPHGTVCSRPDGEWKRVIARSDYPSLIEKYKSGNSLDAIGEEYGVSRERIRQILSAHGIGKMDGGATMRGLRDVGKRVDAIRAKNERREAWCRERWDLNLEGYEEHVAEYGSCSLISSPMHKYMHHRKNARQRGLGWNFTFATWWRVWQESGKWTERGRGKTGYVMARWGDGDAPYGVDTVYICTQSENAKDGYIVSPGAERAAKARITRAMKSIGAQP